MPWTLLAVNTPSPPTFSGVHDLTAGGAIVAETINAGESSAGLAKINRNATRLDITGRYGGGGYAITEGLAISAGSGLTLNISAGHAMMDGPVEVETGTTATLTDNIARVWIWLSQAGAIVQVNNSLTPPAGAHVLLGSAVTSAGAITSVDQSGVLYSIGGTLFRRSADASTPTDAPSSRLQFVHRGSSKLWWWDGTTYWELSAGSSSFSHATVAITGNQSLTQPEVVSSALTLSASGVSSRFVLTFPTAAGNAVAGQSWSIRNTTSYGCTLKMASGSDVAFLGAACMGIFFYDGTNLRAVGKGDYESQVDTVEQVVSSPTDSYSFFEEVLADFVPLTPSGGNVIVTWPSTNAPRGHHQVIENGHTSSLINIRGTGATGGDAYNNQLLPGQAMLFYVDGGGASHAVPCRPRTKRRTVTFPSDANYTLGTTIGQEEELLGFILEIAAGTLTAGRDLILPACEDQIWYVKNKNAQTVTCKAATGAGVALTTGQRCFIYFDSTDFVAMVPPA